jgi:hypothetical protein
MGLYPTRKHNPLSFKRFFEGTGSLLAGADVGRRSGKPAKVLESLS